MPNWCYNSVIVSADTEAELEEFIKFAKQTHNAHGFKPFTDEREEYPDQQGVFWNFITPPEEIREEYFGHQPRYSDSLPVGDPDWWKQVEERRKVSNHWYDWNITNWGTKWDIIFDEYSENHIDEDKYGKYYFNWYFETAWSPAVPVYLAMSERFPNLTFDFEITEEANFYVGKLILKNGIVKEEFIDNPTHEDFFDLDIPCTHCGRAGYKYCEREED